MEEENERRVRGMKNLSLEKLPRDLLQRFMSSSASSTSTSAVPELRSAVLRSGFAGREEEEEEEEEEEDGDDSEELELNLGLSLGGRFGVDTSKRNKLVRSSSIIGTVPFIRDSSGGIGGGVGGADASASPSPAMAYPALVRTSSLPVETEDEWRKRKEIQTLRRMAAKRRRSEKQRNSAGGAGDSRSAERDEEDIAVAAASVSRQNSVGGGVDLTAARSQHVASQISAESQGGSSSGMSEFESRTGQGSSSYSETRSRESQETVAATNTATTTGPSGTKAAENKCSTSGSKTENPPRNPNLGRNRGGEIGMNAMEDMPCVFTKGEGPNGRRVDGILYRYGKGEEVRIMCVCHGKFLSPAEFVKHAGGGDVDHPLRRIVINPSSTSLL